MDSRTAVAILVLPDEIPPERWIAPAEPSSA